MPDYAIGTIREQDIGQDLEDEVSDINTRLFTASSEPLTVDTHGFIQTGIWWIGCKAGNGRKPAKPKHQCPDCGAKHAIRK